MKRFILCLSMCCIVYLIGDQNINAGTVWGNYFSAKNQENAAATGTPRIMSLTASPEIITRGYSAKLTAMFSGGTGTVDHGVGTVKTNKSYTVKPKATTIYTLTVKGSTGKKATKSMTVVVVPPPAKPEIYTSSFITIEVGQENLANVEAQEGCTYNWSITGGKIMFSVPDGTQMYYMANDTATMVNLSCTATNAAGKTSAPGTKTVTTVRAPYVETFFAYDNYPKIEDGTYLSAAFCFEDEGTTAVINPGGIPIGSSEAVQVYPAMPTLYELTVTNAAGWSVKSRVAVSPGQRLAGEFGHSLFLKADGTVWACGNNTFGELGDGTTTQRLTPVQVVGLGNDVVAVAAGGYIKGAYVGHEPYGFSVALRKDGSVWVWGSNTYGQLGMGTMDNDPHPTPIKVGIEHVVAISTSVYRTIALLQDGTVWRWGMVTDWIINLGKPTAIPPTCVKGMPKMVAVTAGGGEDMCLTNEGTVWDIGSTNVAVPFRQAWLDNAVAVTALTLHWQALRSDGTLWAWGDNTKGQLGDGTMQDTATGVLVQNLTSDEVITGIAVGYYHSLSLGEAGIWTWGANGYGQLGDGPGVTMRLVPSFAIAGRFSALAAGEFYNLTVDWNGSVWVWGDNTYGQLGDGTTIQRNTPIQVPNFSLW